MFAEKLFSVTFTPQNEEAKTKAMQLAIDATWRAQWESSRFGSHKEKDGWVRHSRLHLGAGQVDLIIRRYDTKDECWSVSIDWGRRMEGKFVVRASSEADLKKIWREMTVARPGEFPWDKLSPRDMRGEPVFETKPARDVPA